MIIPWTDDAIDRGQRFLRETQREMSTDDPDRLLEIVEQELDETIVAWADGDPIATEWMDSYYIVRGMLRFHRTTVFLKDMAVAASDNRKQTLTIMIEAARSAGRVHQDWAWVEIEVTAAFWGQAEDPW